jgi:hypothetical protein
MRTINWKKRELIRDDRTQSTYDVTTYLVPITGIRHMTSDVAHPAWDALKKTLPKYMGRGPYFEHEFIGFEPKGILVKVTYSTD